MFESCKNRDQLAEEILKFIKDKKEKNEARPAMLAMAIWKGRVHYSPGGQNWAQTPELYDRPLTKEDEHYYEEVYLDACRKLVELGEPLPQQTETNPFMGLLRIAERCLGPQKVIKPQRKKKRKPITRTVKSVLAKQPELENHPTKLIVEVNKILYSDGYGDTDLRTLKTTLTRLRNKKK